MNDIQLKLSKTGQSKLIIENETGQVAEMVFAIDDAGKNLTIYHTEVSETLKGQGIGMKLLSFMVEYAREHHLKVIPLCSFVMAQFTRHPELYTDVWNKSWH